MCKTEQLNCPQTCFSGSLLHLSWQLFHSSMDKTKKKKKKSTQKESVSCSVIQLFTTTWTVACQASLSMEFSRQEYLSGQPFLSPDIFPTKESNLCLLCCRQIHYHLNHPGRPFHGSDQTLEKLLRSKDLKLWTLFFHNPQLIHQENLSTLITLK